MATKAYTNRVVTATDTYKTAIVNKIEPAIDDVYTNINKLANMNYTTNGSSPGSPLAGDLWLDGSTSPAILKYRTGAGAWTQIGGPTPAYISGVGIDDAMQSYISPDCQLYVYLKTVYVPAYAVISIAGSLRRVTANTHTASFSGQATGRYDIYAQQSGTSAFTLGFVATNYFGAGTIPGTARYIGSVYWVNDQGFRAVQATPHIDGGHASGFNTKTAFHVYANSTGQTCANSATITVAYNAVLIDNSPRSDNGFSDAADTYYIPRSGVWMLWGRVTCPANAGDNYITVSASMYKTGTSIIYNRTTPFAPDSTQLVGGTGGLASPAFLGSLDLHPIIVYAAQGDTISMQMSQTNHGSDTLTLETSAPYYNYMAGLFLGTATTGS